MKFRSSVCLAFAVCLLAACSSSPRKHAPPSRASNPVVAPPSPGANAGSGKDCSRYAPAQEDPSTRGDYTRGGLYKPGVRDTTPDFVPDLDCIAEPSVRDEPHSAFGNNTPYTVLGKKYKVLDSAEGYDERGTASYYGNKFHGRLTSNHEVYDMYAFTAAHKTLPLPSFARVTNLDNGKSVVVRVNDRGPFHDGRIIDLSYAAAVKLGITARGTGNVEVRGLTAGDAASAAPAPRDVERATRAAKPVAPLRAAQQQSVEVQETKASLPTPTPSAVPSPPEGEGVAESDGRGSAKLHLQVASYASRDNAERALGKLRGAGVDGASIVETDAGGNPRWRVRVESDEEHADLLAQRIAQLGFGLPQRVRD